MSVVACLRHKEKKNVRRKATRQTPAGPAHPVALRHGRGADGAARCVRRAGAAVSRCNARNRLLGISDLQDGVGYAADCRRAGAVCLAPVPIAIEYGFFQKHNLDVELVNYSGSTDQLLEAIATGKSDAGLGMALRWLKPLEQGFDVKIAAGTHGGCMRVLTRTSSSVEKLADLKGKIVAVGDLAGPDKNFFSIQLAKLGIDPNKDVDWRAYPGNLLNLAVEKGEVQAFLASDPLAHLWLKDSQYKEVASNLDGEYRDKSCCILGLRGSLVREEPQVARAITQALLDAAMFTAQNPDKAAKSFQPYAPKAATLADLEAMARYHTHHHHPVGDVLKRELKGYADDLKTVSVFKPSTDTAKFAEKIYVDVFGV